MSLQSRLTALIAAIGADVKSFNTKFNDASLVGFGQLRLHGTYTDFNAISNFGYSYVKGSANGPGIVGGNNDQYYTVSLSLGSEYPYSQYAYQIAYKRGVPGVFASRHREAGTWGPWVISGLDPAVIDGGTL